MEIQSPGEFCSDRFAKSVFMADLVKLVLHCINFIEYIIVL